MKLNIGDAFANIKDKAVEEIANIDMESINNKTRELGKNVSEKASQIRDAALDLKDDITEKLTELDRMLDRSVTEYNDAYTNLNDTGMQLFIERSRAVDTVENVQYLINSIANHPKFFDKEFEEIQSEKEIFMDSYAFAEMEIRNARKAATDAGTGIAAGAAVAMMGPTTAMWIATTFGTASTGAAISTLSGAAATNAALAWLGGGTLAAGGHGILGGSTLLAMAGPIGWGAAGAVLLGSIALFYNKKLKTDKQKNEEITKVKKNTERITETNKAVSKILEETRDCRNLANKKYMSCLNLFNGDYSKFTDDELSTLSELWNITKALSKHFSEIVKQDE